MGNFDLTLTRKFKCNKKFKFSKFFIISINHVWVTFQIILETLLRLIYPILPHTTDEAYQSLYKNNDITICLADEFNVSIHSDENFWKPLIQMRSDVLKKLEEYKAQGIENSLDAGLILSDSMQKFENPFYDLSDFFGVSRVSFHKNEDIIITDLRDMPRCERSWKRDETVSLRDNGLVLSDRDLFAINDQN